MIVFDDTWRRFDGWRGKGGTAVPALLGTGQWQLREDLLPACIDAWEPEKSFVPLSRL
jgi:hypothetical protein